MKDQIDRMKRKKVMEVYSSDEEESLERPTIKKGGAGDTGMCYPFYL